MLRSDLVDLVNTGRAWAFVGAGASVDSGGVSWGKLVEQVVSELPVSVREQVQKDTAFKAAMRAREFARAFGVIEREAGRETLEVAVRAGLPAQAAHGSLVRRLAEWPFEGYVTLNYDGLLETALASQNQLGWSVVGNQPSELRQLSGGADKIVWHLHGAASQSEEQSHLVLTDSDYDAVYLGDTLLKHQLRAILGTRRVVFFGFGFRDAEILRVLKEVGRLADPTRPIIAFLNEDVVAAEGGTTELLTRYNVDVLTYPAPDGDHGALRQLVHTYAAFLLRRSLRYRRPARAIPSYDPETTGLLIYNELVLSGDSHLDEGTFDVLLRARILSLLEARSRLTVDDIDADVATRTRLIHHGQGAISLIRGRIEAQLDRLAQDGLAARSDDTYEITATGRNAVSSHAGTSERLSRQFVASLQQRAEALAGVEANSVSALAEAFLKECARRRSLGLAMVMAATSAEQDYQMVALLQRLPEFLQESQSEADALVLSRLIRDVLADPSDAERTYIGLALQAQFGAHLLSLDPDALHARLRQLSSSAFVIDASTLIPYLAPGSHGHAPAQTLVSGLREAGSAVGTTPLLVTEIEEHARWAAGRVGSTGEATEETLAAALGKDGSRSNEFLEGFLTAADTGVLSKPSLFSYFRESFHLQPKQKCPAEEDVVQALTRSGVGLWELSEWGGFQETMWVERDELAEAIGERRRRTGSFTHDRQVRAEAEALLTVRYLRDGTFSTPDASIDSAFFVSNTRLIDELDDPRTPVTMRPEAVLHLLATLHPAGAAELAVFTEALLSELDERGLTLIDRRRLLHVFGPLIDASQERLESELSKYRELMASTFGEDAERAYAEVDALDVPAVLSTMQAQRAERLEGELERERERSAMLAREAKVSEREREDLERFRAEEKIRRGQGRAKQRSAQSRRRRKRK